MANPDSYKPSAGEIPVEPGVYRFWDERDQVIYVGKAKSLRSRLSSYFQSPAALTAKTLTMVTTACRVDWTVVSNEREALQLEYQWIKEFAPRFNIKYRDDKSYPFLAVTLGERFPRPTVMRGNRKPGTRYFGPFAQAWAIRETVDILLRVFPVRSCAPGVFRQAERSGRPCLLAHIDRCSAPCVGRVTESEHRLIALRFCDFMAGGSQPIVDELTSKMNDAAQAQDYEGAARYRDDLGAVKKALEKSALVFSDNADADVFAMATGEVQSFISVFHIRQGRVRGQRSFAVERVEDLTESALLAAVVGQFYASGEMQVPPLILVPLALAQQADVEAVLAATRHASVEIRVPQRGQMKDFMETAQANALDAQRVGSLKRSVDLTARSSAMMELQEALGLPTVPYRIECIDISHTAGTNVVGSLVVFVDGLPAKDAYRSYGIRGEYGVGDPAAIQEVVARRFKSGVQDVVDMPDLLVVDGGPAQVAAAAAQIESLGLAVPVIGLAKRLEEVWRPQLPLPAILGRSSEALFLLQRLRDESHRSAIGLHRKRRSKAMLVSALDAVPGLGPVRRSALLAEFGSVRALQSASVEAIAAVRGISGNLAAVIKATLDVSPLEASMAAVTKKNVQN